MENGIKEFEVTNPDTIESPYLENCFIKFGFSEIDKNIDVDGTIEFLGRNGLDDNPLTRVRKGSDVAREIENVYVPNKYGVHYCDFCYKELIGGEFQVLADGRERCNHCSSTSIKTQDDFIKVFRQVLIYMQSFFGIQINTPIHLRMVNAKEIEKETGVKFTPTPGFDGRVLGFARKDKSGEYSLFIENGSPKLASMATMAHELTHIWQFLNWDFKEIHSKYGKRNHLVVLEGMAKWAEIQFLIQLNEIEYAKRQEIYTRERDDEYGVGFKLYCNKYPLKWNGDIKKSPFKEKYPL